MPRMRAWRGPVWLTFLCLVIHVRGKRRGRSQGEGCGCGFLSGSRLQTPSIRVQGCNFPDEGRKETEKDGWEGRRQVSVWGSGNRAWKRRMWAVSTQQRSVFLLFIWVCLVSLKSGLFCSPMEAGRDVLGFLNVLFLL